MKFSRFLMLVCCLASRSALGEKKQALSIESMSVYSDKTDFKSDPSIEKALFQSAIIVLETTSNQFLQGEVAYPIEESNFTEVYGGAP